MVECKSHANENECVASLADSCARLRRDDSPNRLHYFVQKDGNFYRVDETCRGTGQFSRSSRSS